jgi:6-phosphogluconolactonase (cycloisomerase 2 family)
LAPNGKFAYVINENPIGLNGQYGPLNLVIYSIGSDGSLTAVGTPMPLDEYYGCCSLIAIAPKGDFLYLASDYVFVYAVDANTGALTEVAGSPFVPNPDPTFPAHDPTSPMALAVAPSGNYLYAHDAMYSVAPGTGVLTTMNFFYHNLSNLAENGGPMVLNSTGTDAYMQGVDEGWVASFSVNTATGELTPTGNVQGQYSDLSYGNNSGSKSPSIAVDPTGAYLYALWDTGWSSNGQFTGPGEVSIYSLNSSSRLLAYIGVVAGTSGTKPYAIAFATE